MNIDQNTLIFQDNTVRIRACEGIMVLACLEDSLFVNSIAESDLPLVLCKRLENLFNAIPAHVYPNEIEDVEVTWGLDSPLLTSERKFPGCRKVASFFMWLDFCNHLIKEAHPKITEVLAKTIRMEFFEKTVTPAFSGHHAVLVTSLVTKCLKEITSTVLFRGIYLETDTFKILSISDFNLNLNLSPFALQN